MFTADELGVIRRCLDLGFNIAFKSLGIATNAGFKDLETVQKEDMAAIEAVRNRVDQARGKLLLPAPACLSPRTAGATTLAGAYPSEIVVTLTGNGDDSRPDETYTIGRDEDRVWVDCGHHEQCGEIYENVSTTDDPVRDFVLALEQILVQTGLEIEAGAAPAFVEVAP